MDKYIAESINQYQLIAVCFGSVGLRQLHTKNRHLSSAYKLINIHNCCIMQQAFDNVIAKNAL